MGIGNCALEIYCLVLTQGNHCIVWYAQRTNDLLPMTNCQGNLMPLDNV